jgi:hypothetical protein
MFIRLWAAISALPLIILSSNQAFALCWMGYCDTPTPPSTPGNSGPVGAPEIDGPGALWVLALLVSFGIALYRRAWR